MILNPTKELRAAVDLLTAQHPGQHPPEDCPTCKVIAECRATIRALPCPAPDEKPVGAFVVSSRDLGNNWTVHHHARRLGLLPPFTCPVCDADLTEKDWKARHCPQCEPTPNTN